MKHEYAKLGCIMAIGTLVTCGCEARFADIVGDAKTPLSAQFQESGSSCEVIVNFESSVRGLPQAQPYFYRLETGGQALRVEPIPETLALLVTFPDNVGEFDLIRFAEGTDIESLLPVTRRNVDAFPGAD